MWANYNGVLERTDSVLHSIVDQARADRAAPMGSDVQKLGTFYGTCMDSAAVEAAGIKPLMPVLDRIAAIRTPSDVQREIGAPPVKVVDVTQPDFFRVVDDLFQHTPIDTWKAYLRWHVLNADAPALSSAFVNEDFRYSKSMSGATVLLPRWKRCLRMANSALSQVLGKEYVKRAFTPEAKARALEMVNNLQAALHDRIEALTWMSAPTKREAPAKLAAFTRKIGYPDKWKSYSNLQVKPGPFVTNIVRARRFEASDDLDKIGKPVDRVEWDAYPQLVDAYYNSSLNEVVFPAGILQPPWFDPKVDDAVNYGGVGTVIGHEMMHGFDDGGGSPTRRAIWATGGRHRARPTTRRVRRKSSISLMRILSLTARCT